MSTTKLSFAVDPLHPPPLSDYAPKERGPDGIAIRMDELEQELNRRDPIDMIASFVRVLTFGEMEQLAEELCENQGLGDIDAFAVMKRLHEWQKRRKVTPPE